MSTNPGSLGIRSLDSDVTYPVLYMLFDCLPGSKDPLLSYICRDAGSTHHDASECAIFLKTWDSAET